jgi:hypothetical protein
MPGHLGAWIKMEPGIQHLMPEETSKGLGAPKEDQTTLSASMLKCTTGLFHWEFLLAYLTLPPQGDNSIEATVPLTDEDWPMTDLKTENKNSSIIDCGSPGPL